MSFDLSIMRPTTALVDPLPALCQRKPVDTSLQATSRSIENIARLLILSLKSLTISLIESMFDAVRR